jgi:hypothetical protein
VVDLVIPFVIHWDGEPAPDLSGIDEPVYVPFEFVQVASAASQELDGSLIWSVQKTHAMSPGAEFSSTGTNHSADSLLTLARNDTKTRDYGPSVEDLPIVDDPFTALLHYLTASGAPVRLPIDDIDISDVKPSQFPAVRDILRSGVSGQFLVTGTLGYATSGLNAAFVGRIVLNISGAITVDERGSYSFEGTLGARPDTYRFYPSNSRTTAGELSTRVGQMLPGAPFTTYITGRRRVTEWGGRVR